MEQRHNYICPTCHSTLAPGTRVVAMGGDPTATRADDVRSFAEQASRLVKFLGAVTTAMPLAMTAHIEHLTATVPEWANDLAWLAEELAQQATRRIGCAIEASLAHESTRGDAMNGVLTPDT